MAEGVRQAAQFARLAQLQLITISDLFEGGQVVELRQTPESAPEAGGRALVEQDGVLAVGQQRHQGAFLWQRLARFGYRKIGFPAQQVGATTLFQRAQQAAGLAAGAERGTQVHHRLGVVVDALLRRETFGDLPELPGHFRLARVAALGNIAGQHALDVAVEDGRAQAHAQAGNGAGGGATDAGQLGELFHVTREFAAVPFDDDLRGLVQVARTAVVTQAGPQVQHFVFFGGGQGLDRGQGVHEAVEVTEHGADLGLLQHDLGDPNAVRRDALLPGQILAAVTVIPAEYGGAELFRAHRLNRPLRASLSSGLTLSPSFSSIFSLSFSPASLAATLPSASLSKRQALAPSSSGPRQRSGHSMPS